MKQNAARQKREALQTAEAREILKLLTGRSRKAMEEAFDMGNGFDWLSHAPLDHLGLSLDRQRFFEAIALRMGVELPDSLPDFCPSCGAPFDIAHALKCKNGDWVKRRHNEVARTWATLFKRVSPTVEMEPYLSSPVGAKRPSTSKKVGARADIFATGIFRNGQGAYFDIAVIDTGAACHVAALKDKEQRKRVKYEERAEMAGGTFAPLVCSVYGTLAPEAAKVLSLAIARLDEENGEKRSSGRMLRVGVQVAILKATSLCLRARSMTEPPKETDLTALSEDCQAAMSDARPMTDDSPLASKRGGGSGV